MSTVYSQASIIVPQSAGYQADLLHAWNPQTSSLVDFDVVRNTTATRVNESGLIESVAANVPRIDWPIGGGCPSLLVEPQRTNLLLRSEEFDDGAWLKSQVTVTANDEVAPDGTLTADKLVELSSINVSPRVEQLQPVTAGAIYTVSSYVKKSERQFLQIIFFGGEFGLNAFANFDLDAGAVGTVGSAATASIVDVGNGWYRCTATAEALATSNASGVSFRIITSATATRGQTYTGDGTSGIFLWGAQLEEGSTASSYIPTVASTVTRVADVVDKTGISSLIGQTAGTLYLEFNATGLVPSSARINLSDETNVNWVFISIEANKLRGFVRANGVTIFSDETISATANNKVAIAYQSGSIALYINGVQIQTDASTFTFSSPLSQFGTNLGASNQISDAIVVQATAVFTSRLSNTELASLTTL
jgi:hypothetical protein